jgi:hypothetical protein
VQEYRNMWVKVVEIVCENGEELGYPMVSQI